MSFLTEFYLLKPYNPAIMLLIFWLIWPGALFAVAPIFESRPLPLWKGQSRQFFPGDFMLGLVFVMLIGINAKQPLALIQDPFFWVATGIAQAIIALGVRIPDVARYPERSRNSPTKVVHDFFGYFVCGWLLSTLGFPQFFWSIAHNMFGNCRSEWNLMLFAGLFYGATVIWDNTHPFTREDLIRMHPDDWRPCWKK